MEKSGFNKAWDCKDKNGEGFFNTKCDVKLGDNDGALSYSGSTLGNVRLLTQANIESLGGTKDKFCFAATFSS